MASRKMSGAGFNAARSKGVVCALHALSAHDEILANKPRRLSKDRRPGAPKMLPCPAPERRLIPKPMPQCF